MGWFKKTEEKKMDKNIEKKTIPDGLWIKCPACEETLFKDDLETNNQICNKCSFHFRLPVEKRLEMLIDKDTFTEINRELVSCDPLKFVDSISYKDRIKKYRKRTNRNSAIITGYGKINNIYTSIGLIDFTFAGGSLGSVMGEKIVRLIEHSIENNLPLIIVSASGGARMQEGILSLMQMAKTSAALTRLSEKKLPYISILTDPTSGGVTASFAMLGDIIVAEPGALVAFAGPRVIKQTIRQQLPVGFQRAEFVQKHGFIDIITHRNEMKNTIAKLLKFMLE